jgi:aryl-alcohol dehydrogenase-like predicted oxidoreductase
MFKRQLGQSGIQVSALGMGCWAIGGPWDYDDGENGPSAAGWGKIDDAESIRAIHAGLDMGVNFFDTAANYGAGHSERILAQALKGRRDEVVLATKFGYVVDQEKKFIARNDDVILANIRQDCEDSLRRLNTDYIDLYQFHVGEYEPQKAGAVRDALERLAQEGKIRCYGWSTDNVEGARVFAQGEHCTAVQHFVNWATQFDFGPILDVCEEFDLASINRGPLTMGLLTGKFQSADAKLPADDVRHGWNFREGRLAEILQSIEALRETLTSDGRTLAQGALGWLWARNERMIPIPGFKTVAQVQENAGALEFGPLGEEQMRTIDEILGRKVIAAGRGG